MDYLPILCLVVLFAFHQLMDRNENAPGICFPIIQDQFQRLPQLSISEDGFPKWTISIDL